MQKFNFKSPFQAAGPTLAICLAMSCALEVYGQAKTTDEIMVFRNSMYATRLSYHAERAGDRRFATVVNLCGKPGACETKLQREFIKLYLETGKGYITSTEDFAKNVDLLRKKGDKFANFLVPGSGPVVGQALEVIATNPELFNLTTRFDKYQSPTETPVDAKTLADKIDSLSPEARSFLDSITAKKFNVKSSDGDYIDPETANQLKSQAVYDKLVTSTKDIKTSKIDIKKVNEKLNEMNDSLKKSIDQLAADNKELLNLAKSQAEQIAAEQKQRASFEKVEQTRLEVAATFNLLAIFVGSQNPRAGRQIQAVGSATDMIMRTVADKSPSKLVMMSNYASAAMVLAQAFSQAGPSSEELMFDSLQRIEKSLEILHAKTDRLIEISTTGFQKVLDDLQNLKYVQLGTLDKVKELQSQIFDNDLKAKLKDRQENLAVLHKFRKDCIDDYLYRNMTKRDAFKNSGCLAEFQFAASERAFSSTWIDIDLSTASNIESDVKAIDMLRPRDVNRFLLTDINPALAYFRSAGLKGLPEKIPNIAYWNQSAQNYVDYVFKYFAEAGVTANSVQEVRAGGLQIRDFFSQTIGSKTFHEEAAKHVDIKYKEFLKTLQTALHDIDADANTQPLSSLIYPKIQSYGGSGVNSPNTTPTDMAAGLPQAIRTAEYLGLGKVDGFWGWQLLKDQRMSLHVYLWFKTNTGKDLQFFGRERTATLFPDPEEISASKGRGSERLLWEYGKGYNAETLQKANEQMQERLNGNTLTSPPPYDIQQPLYQGFVANSKNLVNFYAAQQSIDLIKEMNREKLNQPILANLPIVNFGITELAVSTDARLQSRLNPVRNKYFEFQQAFKAYQLIVESGSFFVSEVTQNCLDSLNLFDPNLISKTGDNRLAKTLVENLYGRPDKPVIPLQIVASDEDTRSKMIAQLSPSEPKDPLLGALSEVSKNATINFNCHVKNPKVESVEQTLQALDLIEQLSKPAEQKTKKKSRRARWFRN
jgi:hypothetical protein